MILLLSIEQLEQCSDPFLKKLSNVYGLDSHLLLEGKSLFSHNSQQCADEFYV